MEQPAAKVSFSNREKTDKLCFYVFLLLFCFWVATGVYAVRKGNSDLVSLAFDSSGNQCGKNGSADFRLLYLDSPALRPGKSACVRACPRGAGEKLDCFSGNGENACGEFPVYESAAVFDKICVSKAADFPTEKARLKMKFAEQVIGDLKSVWPVLLFSFAFASLLGFLLLKLLEAAAEFVLLLISAGAVVGLVALSRLSYSQFHQLSSQPTRETLLYKSIALLLICAAAALVVLLLCLYRRIALAKQMVAAAAEFLSSNRKAAAFPLFFSFVFLLVFSLALLVCVNSYSIGVVHFQPGDFFGQMVSAPPARLLVYFNVFALLFGAAFLLLTNQLVIAAAAVAFYFKLPPPSAAQLLRLGWGVHLGSVAFGAFMLAANWSVGLLAALAAGGPGGRRGGPRRLLDLCLCVVNKLLLFFNKHAMVEVALRGRGYCAATAEGGRVVAGNMARFAALAGLLELLLLFNSVAVACATTAASHFALRRFAERYNVETATVFPYLAFAFVGATVAAVFNSLLETSGDAMMHCFALEEEAGGQDALRKRPMKWQAVVGRQDYVAVSDQPSSLYI